MALTVEGARHTMGEVEVRMTLNSQQVELLDVLVKRWELDSVGDLVHAALTELMSEPADQDLRR